MATTPSSYRPSIYQRGNSLYPDCSPTPLCDTTPACPACGGLECLCRPRFFAGQLLTDEDLNRLDHYITAKNRLHNRYLVGSGVACGLEVICNTCAGEGNSMVIVRPGYAVSPCGNDIVVCKNTAVNICDLINKCRPQTDNDCAELFPTSSGATTAQNTTCSGGTEQWVLAVCYAEKPSRGVGALRESANGPSGCSCGGGCANCGGSSGGCSCSGATSSPSSASGANGCGCTTASTTKTAKQAKNAPLSCEPTLTCEGYGFKVYKAPSSLTTRTPTYGEAAKRYICCILPLLENVRGSLTGKAFDYQQTYNYLIGLRNVLIDFIRNQGFYDCELASRLAGVAVATPSNNTYDLSKKSDQNLLMESYANSLQGFSAIAEEILQKCLCAALLPPCSAAQMADCVPLATVTVSSGDCKVMRVCNVSAREFLPTWPNIQYWLSFFSSQGNIFSTLRRIFERWCCTELRGNTPIGIKKQANGYVMQAQLDSVKVGAEMNMNTSTGNNTQANEKVQAADFTRFLSDALAQPERQVTAQTFFLGSLGVTDSNGKPLLSEAEQAQPTDFLLAHQVMAPLLQQLLPEQMLAMLTGGQDTSSAASTNVDALAKQMDALKQQLADQQKTIDALSKQSKP